MEVKKVAASSEHYNIETLLNHDDYWSFMKINIAGVQTKFLHKNLQPN